ncbi:MAG: aminotransferase class V-fold PLP-dependent enzyme [Firmicutes bacterium]|nr:aminotransferase class V-fold PLP-dependent enzyme [Bacillota bacterium]
MKTLEQVRKDFSFVNECIYLDSATTGLSWDGQADLAGGFYREAKRRGYAGGHSVWAAKEEKIKDRLAGLWRTKPGEIYFYSSTTEFVNLIAYSLKIEAGQTIVMACGEYPAIVKPWQFLVNGGVGLVFVDISNEEYHDEELIKAIDERTKLVVVSHVQYTTGTKADLVKLGKACHEKGTLLFVDGTQAFGATDTDLSEVDFYVASTFKWSLGAFGLGVAMIKETALDDLDPAYCGYGGARMQYGTPNYPTLWTLDGALDYFEEVGWDKVYDQVSALTDHLMDGLRKLGIDVLTPRNAKAGIISFQHEKGAEIETEMAKRKIYFAYRDGFVRIAPHFYNTIEDIDTMLGALAEMI